MITITYESETVLPQELDDIIKKMEKRLCEVSSEPDKTVCIMGDFKYRLIVWMSEHQGV